MYAYMIVCTLYVCVRKCECVDVRVYVCVCVFACVFKYVSVLVCMCVYLRVFAR